MVTIFFFFFCCWIKTKGGIFVRTAELKIIFRPVVLGNIFKAATIRNQELQVLAMLFGV